MKASYILALIFSVFATTLSAAENLSTAFKEGEVLLNIRTRYEAVDQGAKDATALTLRARLGFKTAPINGFAVMAEVEHISALDSDSYSQAGINPGGAGRAVIADPEGTEINQISLGYQSDNTKVTLGRQRLVLDKARFIGDVGWRQNQQTFDAFSMQNSSLAKTTLTYAYLSQINRILGEDHPQGRWDSNSHLFNANYTGFAAGKVTGYGYLLDFDNARTNSCATYGASFVGKHEIDPNVNITYRAEYARQADYASSPLSYENSYTALEVGISAKQGSFSIGHEILGSDRGVGFKTPLATLHAYNGWADVFLATPASGLRDTYAKASIKMPAKFALLAFYHQFKTDVNSVDLGYEWDAQISRKFSQNFKGVIKYADFTSDNPLKLNTRKFWLQIEYTL